MAADRGGDEMRMIVLVELDTTTANRAISDGSFAQAVELLLDRLRPEASYFYARGGRRAFLLVADVREAASLPGFAEPLWQQLNAHIEVLPCMNLEELREGLSRVG
jgi:hypothetical protein